jgi:hypothetical protein
MKNALSYYIAGIILVNSKVVGLAPGVPVLPLSSKSTFLFFQGKDQGCQIFLGTKYQNGRKYTK